MSISSDSETQLMQEWAASSRILYYTVFCISVITLPALLFILIILRRYRSSAYFCFLSSIIIANFLLLATIFTNVLADRTQSFLSDIIPGAVICKMSAFLVNTCSFFVHWIWVALYIQRFILIFFPLRAHRWSDRTKEIIGCIFLFSIFSQMWVPILITELDVSTDGHSGSYCAEDPSIIGENSLKLLMFCECFITFFIPLILTVIADISVLALHHSSSYSNFTVISSGSITLHELPISEETPLKIVHKSKLMCAERRRNYAIRRCLLFATLTLLLNLPNYSLQLIDEFYRFSENENIQIRRNYIRVDAFVYIIYLLQFPILPIYILCLKTDFDRGKIKSTLDYNTTLFRRSTIFSYV